MTGSAPVQDEQSANAGHPDQTSDLRAHITAIAARQESVEYLTIRCRVCGTETTADANAAGRDCAFCGTPLTATATSTKHIRPDSLLPFRITSQQAGKIFAEWVNGLWLAPNGLKRLARQEKPLSGVYLPCWSYGSDTTSSYSGRRGEHYYVTEHYTTHDSQGKPLRKTRRVRKTRWSPVSGTVRASFDEILAPAGNALPQVYIEKFEPRDLENLVPFKDEHLSGFSAVCCRVDAGDGFERASETMDDRILSLVRQDIGGDEQRIDSVRTQHSNVRLKHILLPVWISTYRCNNKPCRFIINGRTGQVHAERPWSRAKIVLLILGTLAVAAITVTMAALSRA